MTVKLGHLATVLGLVVAATLAAPEVAQAQSCERGCGRVRIHVPPFGVRIGWPPAHIVIRGPIVGYGIEAESIPPPPEPPEPPPPPPPAPAYYGYPAAPPPSPMAYAVAHAREPNIGVGLRVSGLQIGRNGPTASGVGALLRFRSRPVEIELDVGRDSYNDVDRSDTRLGASLYVPLTQGRFVPFLVTGAGVNFSYFGETGDQLHQGFVGIGAGLSLRLGTRFSISADARYILRRFFDDDALVASQPLGRDRDDPNGVRDEAVEGRFNAMLFF